jgi:hypothetical protein
MGLVRFLAAHESTLQWYFGAYFIPKEAWGAGISKPPYVGSYRFESRSGQGTGIASRRTIEHLPAA